MRITEASGKNNGPCGRGAGDAKMGDPSLRLGFGEVDTRSDDTLPAIFSDFEEIAGNLRIAKMAPSLADSG